MNNSKIKKYVLPVCAIALFAAIVIAATVVYFVNNDRKTIEFEAQLTTSSFVQVAGQVAEELGADQSRIVMLNDCNVIVQSGQITKLGFFLAVTTDGECEYWQMQNFSDGIELIYMGKTEPPTVSVSLNQMAQALCSSEEVVGQNYSAVFSNIEHTKAEDAMGSAYYMDSGKFIKVTEDIYGIWHTLNVTQDENSYVFYY